MGQPIPSNVGILSAEHIGRIGLTGGTETSKYPQEKKTIVISLVVASERERAKTMRHVQGRNPCVVGVVGYCRSNLR
jgi:hypothetical protein